MTLSLDELRNAVKTAAAIRYRCRLQPAGGPGDKVFPPTYEGGKYAEEVRIIDGNRVPCVHLDSIQSQANRMELALLEAARDESIQLPIPRVEVQFAGDLAEIGTISSLEVPHRLADAILRDSVGQGGKRFRKTAEGALLDTASLKNASGLFEISPTSLLFGLWDSTGPRGGLGVKFQRTIVSELVAIDVEKGVKSSSRIDPLGIELKAGPIYYVDKTTSDWSLDAKLGGKSLEKAGKDGKPSEVNHGNIPPSFSAINGGVTFSYALQMAVLSLPAIRRLQFPIGNTRSKDVDLSAQTTLAALGLAAAILSIEKGADLRSRCLLIPEGPATWEIVKADGAITSFSLDGAGACKLLIQAVEKARAQGLKWRQEPLILQPCDNLDKLVRRSRELTAQAPAEV